MHNILSTRKSDSQFHLLLDWSGAYDNVNRQFLYYLLEYLNFPPIIVESVKAMYYKSLIIYKLRSSWSDTFHQTIGVKQGCPLSPLLYILYQSVVSWYILNNNNVQPFVAYHLPTATMGNNIDLQENIDMDVRLLEYADDQIISRRSVEDLQTCVNQVQVFSQMTQTSSMSKKKSELIWFGTQVSIPWIYDIIEKQNSYNFDLVPHQEVRYLGVQFTSNAQYHQLNTESNIVKFMIMQLNRLVVSYSYNYSLIDLAYYINTYITSKLIFAMRSTLLNNSIYVAVIDRIRKLLASKSSMILMKRYGLISEQVYISLIAPKDWGGLNLQDLYLKDIATKAALFESFLWAKTSCSLHP